MFYLGTMEDGNSRAEVTTTKVAPDSTGVSKGSSGTACFLEELRVEMMAESMVSVLPSPITSARIPPAAYDGILEEGLCLTSASGASQLQGREAKHPRYVDDISQTLLHVLRRLSVLSVANEP